MTIASSDLQRLAYHIPARYVTTRLVTKDRFLRPGHISPSPLGTADNGAVGYL
jgi:hypothetical protein